MTCDIDVFDQKILAVLTEDGRISVTSLANKIGLSKSPTQARLRRLEKDGVIRGYRAMLDRQQTDESHVTFVEVKLSNKRGATLDAFNAAARKVHEIEECHLIAGDFDYLLKVRTRDLKRYRSVLADKISNLPNLTGTSTYVSMQAVIGDGADPKQDV